MSLVSIPMPEDLEQVLQAVLERDPNKGAEWLRAGFEARLAEFYQQWQALQLSTARFAELLADIVALKVMDKPPVVPGKPHTPNEYDALQDALRRPRSAV